MVCSESVEGTLRMKPIILMAIALAIPTATWRASAQSNPVPPTQLVVSAKQIAAYLNHNYIVDPNRTDLSQNPYTDHNLWNLGWGNTSDDYFDVEYDLENSMLLSVHDDISFTANLASKRVGAPISVTASQANQVVVNFHQFLGIGGDWRAVNTFLCPANLSWTLWYCKYSLFVNGYYSREESILGEVNAYAGTLDGWVRRDPRTYVPVTSPLFTFNQAQQIAANIA